MNNRNTRKRCEIYLQLTIKTPERRATIFIVNFEYVFKPFSSVSTVDFEQVNFYWVPPYQFINAEIAHRCKNLSEIAVPKKGLLSEVVVSKNIFSLFTGPNCSDQFFQEYSVSLIRKVVAAIHSSMDTVSILEGHLQS